MNLFHKSTAEFFGTFAMVFFGCGAIMIGSDSVPLIFGLVVAAMIYALGHISGAHFNPAVTLGFAVARHFPPKEVLAYWIAQFAGSIAAMSVLWFLFPTPETFGAAVLTDTTVFQGLVWEILLTFFLMFVIISVATDTRAVGVMAGVAIGSIVAVGAYVGGPFTGAAMNPARALGPAIFESQWSGFWIYILGPMVGAVLAALIYEWIRCEPNKKDAKGCC